MKPSELLSDESKWTQKAFARNAEGLDVSSWDDSAVCWCIEGALNKCRVRDKQRELISSKLPLIEWNDAPERTFEEVRNLLIECGL